jgi:phospholipase C
MVAERRGLDRIEHLVVLMLENHSFELEKRKPLGS